MAGTVFLDVLIWKCCPGAGLPSSEPQQHTYPPLYRLRGHEGSIHR